MSQVEFDNKNQLIKLLNQRLVEQSLNYDSSEELEIIAKS